MADLFAELVGIVAQSRFDAVISRFLTEWKELNKEPKPASFIKSAISLLRGLKFFRVKVNHCHFSFSSSFL